MSGLKVAIPGGGVNTVGGPAGTGVLTAVS